MHPPAARPLTSICGALRLARLGSLALALSACGGGSSTTTGPTLVTPVITNYTVGGSITGLTSGSIVLANGTTTVTVAADTPSWTFPTSFAPGSSYSVTIQTQPATELCAVTSGATGTNTGNVANVTVACGYGEWTWQSGLSTAGAAGVYGTARTAAAGNTPGGRYASSSWTDASGNFWLFGGVGNDATGATGYLNDLWQYSPTTRQWIWINGGSAHNASGIYGTQGTAAAGNEPGARDAASSWIDSSGNLWLFGGDGDGSTGTAGNLNDLWQFSPSSGQWTWIGGGNGHNASGIYGTQGTAAVGNEPGARYAASSWVDSSGNLWMFGGYGYDSTGSLGKLNDLWKYVPGSAQWTWISGEDAANASGAYGTLGTIVVGTLPGARQSASAWTDSSGNLWLFGGVGYDASGGVGNLNDLWQYNPSSNEWTWFSGGYGHNAVGVYGTLGSGSPGSVPGGRNSSSSWVDSSGNPWLFGGYGSDSTGTLGYLNDLWQYTPAAGT